MKRIVIIIAGIIFFHQAYPQSKTPTRLAPLNPEFIKYLEAKKNGTLKTQTDEGYTLGFIPSPFSPYQGNRALSEYRLKSTTELPTSYDLRTLGLVTPVKSQSTELVAGGTCVAFSTMAVIESRLLAIGEGAQDLSEQNIAACYGFEFGYNDGGNQEMCTAYLSRLDGPVLESQDPYNPSVHTCVRYNAYKYVPEARWLPPDRDLIKQAIMDHGAVWAAVHWQNDAYNPGFRTYYYNGNEPANHAWTVAGWDDFYLTTGGLGAWIIKNSWGDDWADDGYVYCSYADSKMLSEVVYFPEIWETDEVDHLYMYDKLGSVGPIGRETPEAFGLVKFNAGSEQLVTKVGAYAYARTILDFEIYDDFDGVEVSNLLSSLSNQYVQYAGYHTFDLPTEVNGDFYLQVRYRTPGFGYPLPVEIFHLFNGSEPYADPEIEPDVNWYKYTSVGDWIKTDTTHVEDITGFNLTARAYTVDITGPKALFKADKETACVNSTVTYTYLDNEPVTTYEWDFGEGANPATANTAGPHQVTYSTEGAKTVSLTVTGAGSDSRTRHAYVKVVPDIDVVVYDSDAKVTPSGDTLIASHGPEYKLIAFGADTYTWTPAKHFTSNVGQEVVFDPESPGTYSIIVSGQQGACADADTLTVILKIPPPNDNVCDAIELADPPSNLNGVTNINATVEVNEPCPPEGDCSTYGFWCVEGGLQNSIWFWFIAKSEIVAFDGRGMDNQIAIYQAETCEDILNDNYTMVTAFDDDPTRIDEWSFNMETVVEIGKKYFVQIDGSAGGEEGTFRLVYTPWHVGNEQISYSPLLEIYPNPSDGLFNLKFENRDNSPVFVQVYNLSGQLVYEKNHRQAGNSEITLDLADQVPGIYQVSVVMGAWVAHQKVILK